jgi:hypothetical protein
VWFKVDDKLHDHRKTWGIDCAAVGLWTMAGSWCGANGTDGFVPEIVVSRWSKHWQRLAADLVTRGLWAEANQDGQKGWEFVNWSEYQPSRVETAVPLDRLRWRRKQALKKNRVLCDQVVARDRNQCRYCGERVSWADRKSPKGATYDHVDPDGENELDNVVIACRRCNGRKKDRTPHEAGMPLLPVPAPYDPVPGEPEGTRSAPDLSGENWALARETVRDQVGTGSVRVGSRSLEPGPSLNGNGVHPHGASS